MPVEVSPLQLEGYYVREFDFRVRPDLLEGQPLVMQFGLHPQLSGLFNPGDMTVGMQAGIAFNHQDPYRLMAQLEVRSQNAPEIRSPYDFRVVMVGFFRLGAEPPPEQMQLALDALKRTALSVLYSAAREYIAGATSRGPFPGIILPTAVISLDEPSEQEQPAGTKKARRKSTAKKSAKKGRAKKQQR